MFPPLVKIPPTKRVPTPAPTSDTLPTAKLAATRVTADSEFNRDDVIALFDNHEVALLLIPAPTAPVPAPTIPLTVDFPATSPQSIASRLPFS